MITNFKIFENKSSQLYFRQYSVGDIVKCINDEDYKNLKNGNPYEILRAFEIKRGYDNSAEYYVDVIDLKTREYTTSVYSHRFVPEIEYDTNKYNI